MNQDNQEEWLKKRRHPRVAWSFMLSFKPHMKESEGWNMSIVKDISLGGCSFYSQADFEVGLVLDLKIQFPTAKNPIELSGEVKRCELRPGNAKGYCIGVQFSEMEQEKKQLFFEILGGLLNKELGEKG